jgi:hypothetical protein
MTEQRRDGPTLSKAERISAVRKQAADAADLLTRLAETCHRLDLWCQDWPKPRDAIDRRALREADRCAREGSRLALRAAQQLARVQW